MGIKNLNRYLFDACSKTSIEKIHLEQLRDKTIVIDTSIYLYKYMGQDALIENFYYMISLFHEYHIIPLFVFDGKPPPDKYELLKYRRKCKIVAEEKYNCLKEQLKQAHPRDRAEILLMMDCLKKQFLRIHETDIERVKTLISYYGAMYYVAKGEADHLCAQIVMSGKAWACLSDDMDMLVHGCTRVLRHFSLLNHTVLQYHLNPILADLDIPLNMFRQMMVLYGTDYLQTDSLFEFYELMDHYKQYKNAFESSSKCTPFGFYQWITKHTSYKIKYDVVLRIYRIFCEGQEETQLDELKIEFNNQFDKKQLYAYISEDGFIVSV